MSMTTQTLIHNNDLIKEKVEKKKDNHTKPTLVLSKNAKMESKAIDIMNKHENNTLV